MSPGVGDTDNRPDVFTLFNNVDEEAGGRAPVELGHELAIFSLFFHEDAQIRVVVGEHGGPGDGVVSVRRDEEAFLPGVVFEGHLEVADGDDEPQDGRRQSLRASRLSDERCRRSAVYRFQYLRFLDPQLQPVAVARRSHVPFSASSPPNAESSSEP